MKTQQHLYSLKTIFIGIICAVFIQCNTTDKMTVDVYETSEKGNALTLIRDFKPAKKSLTIHVDLDKQFQKITGFDGCILWM